MDQLTKARRRLRRWTRTGIPRKVANLLFSVLLVLSQLFGALALTPTQALAASGNDPMTITMDGGNAHSRHALDGIEAYCCNSYLSSPPNGTVLRHWNSGSLALDYVLYHSDGGPSGVSPHYSWTIAKWVVWAIMEGDLSELDYYADGAPNPQAATNHKLYNEAMAFQRSGGNGPEKGCSRVYDPPSSGFQPICVAGPVNGNIDLQKVSANASITDGNSCYSLAGATYTVYRDKGCTQAETTMTTDAKGYAKSADIAQGTYYVKETAAPKGYLADTKVYEVKVTASNTTRVNGGNVSEAPGNDPSDALVQKIDAEGTVISAASAKDAQGASTLAGAEFTVRFYAGEYASLGALPSAATRTWVYTTDDNGYVNFVYDTPTGDDLYKDGTGKITFPIGTYTVQETKAPEGYRLSDDTAHLVHVVYDAASATGARWEVVDGWGGINFDEDVQGRAITDQAKRGGISVTKVDEELSELGLTGAQGDASLAGIQFEIVNENDGPVYIDDVRYEPGDVITPLTLTTDAEGKATTGKQALPVGTYTVRESATNEGYLDTSTEQTVTITENDDKKVVFCDSDFEDQVVRGGVRIGKVDMLNGEHVAEGSATLEGATFSVENASPQPVKVDGTVYQPGDIVKTITTDAGGIAETGNRDLPYGTYVVREVTPSKGYLLNEDWSLEFSIRTDGVIEDYSAPEFSCPEESIRGDLEFIKVEEGTMSRLAGVPFVITSQTTGEWHVIVTDVNGQASTHTDWAAHSELTNYNDATVELVDGVWTATGELEPNDQAGVWFDGSVDLVAALEDGMGALPYDTYTIQEARCEANEGLALLSATVTVYRPYTTINMGTLDDQPEPAIGTTLTAEDGRHVANVSESVHLFDEVRYENLTELRGTTYTVSGELHLVADDGSDGGVVATAETTFVPAGPSGSVSLEFVFDASGLSGKNVVAFETLLIGDEVVASHEDLGDEGQTVEFPSIQTTLTDTEGWHEADATGDVTLVDTVDYAGLEPRRVYQISGTLMDKSTGEPVLGVDGNPITATANVSSETGYGSVDVTFTFPGVAVRGKTVVAFETLSYDGIEYAVHADIDDDAQTVWFPEIGTTAFNGDDGSKEVIASADQTITDTVSYRNLEPGATYRLDGELVDKETEEVIATATAELVPSDADGEAYLDLSFDATALAGHDMVVFETLSRDEHVVAQHKVLDDEGQTVHIPEIGTTLTDAATADHVALADTEVTLVDTVAYSNLTPGNTYEVTGTLMDKATGEPITDADGNAVTSSTEFVPEDRDGSVDITFTFDGIALAGRSVVAFEDVRRDGFEVAVHADIEDEDQTVHVPEIGTTAKAEGGFDEAAAIESCKITDTVSYRNLVPGKEYLVIGTLHKVEIETRKADGTETYRTDLGELTDVGGFPVTARTTFVPEESDGEVEVTFDFDARELAGEQVVAFEEVRLNGVTVAVHADIEDDGQTIRFPEIHTTAVDGETGQHETQAAAKVTIVDTVEYKGLTPGNSYVAEGTLMNAQSGKPVTDKDGNEITATATFKPEKADGSVDVTFEFDATALAGQTVVAFETLKREGITVAVHADLDDEAQTVRVPQIHTNAYNGTDGSKSISAAKNAKVTDVVTYQGLTPGVEYVLTGTLMDKSTGQPVQQNGKPVTSTMKFTPKQANGQVTMNFTIDATNLSGHDLVVYETLTRTVKGKELVVAKHEDLNSKEQTVKVAPKPTTPTPPTSTTRRTTETLPHTGQGIAAFVLAAAGIGLAGFGGTRLLSARKALREEASEAETAEE